MKLNSLSILTSLLLVSLLGIGIGQSKAVSDQDFAKIHKKLVPKKSALWETIPWEVSILEAKRKAEAKGRLIFMWSMDGHPMGCV